MKLSIITPTYNRANVLVNHLESVKTQRRKDIEHIIIDNFSFDGTRKLVKEYIRKAEYKVVYIREKDGGVYEAMNKGIRKAGGEWIHILNSDDRYADENVLNNILNGKNVGFDVVATGINLVKKRGIMTWLPSYDGEKRHYNFPHPGIFIKNDFYKKEGLYSEKFKIVSDAVFMAVHFPKAKIKIINTITVVMSCEGISSKITLENLKERFTTVMYYHNFPLHYKVKLLIYMIMDFFRGKMRWSK